MKSTASDDRVAAQLAGNQLGNELLDELKDDEHVGAFLHIPGKDNGFDTEGLEINGKRVFLSGCEGLCCGAGRLFWRLNPRTIPRPLTH